MKKIELLAPAGNMDSLKAAIEAGCDAVYLGGSKFGARAFSKNFNDEEIIQAIEYAHLYGVKVYVTLNTLIYEDEVDSFIEYVEFLHKNNVDAVIMQDLGMLDLVRKTFPNLEIHASTQMHIHNLDGVKLMEKLGVKRVVIARETNIQDIERIIKETNTELEVFIHGALCISYSGQCLMSSLIGGRSGNRGTCAGSCRLKYDIIDENNKKINRGNYPLSTKDLNGIEYVGDLIKAGVSSIKIEGRMKSLEYVYMVVSLYRQAIDSYYKNGIVSFSDEDMYKLKKIFNREYTKGFLNNASNNDIINGYRPNHMGVEIGKVINYNNGIATIKLSDSISIGCGLRIIGKNDVGVNVNQFYINGKLVKEANKEDIITIRVNSPVDIMSSVLLTYDKKISDDINTIVNEKRRKILLDGKFIGKLNEKMSLFVSDGINEVIVYGDDVTLALNTPTDRDTIYNKLNKLGDTVYEFNKLDIEINDNIFIPIKSLNDLRRNATSLLNEKRLYKSNFIKENYTIELPDFEKERLITCLVNDENSYNKLDKKYDLVFSTFKMDNTILKLPRVISEYSDDFDGMVGEIGALNKFKNVYTDFSFNVTNSYTVAFLHSLGAKRITLSYELNDKQIKDIIDNYHLRYNKHPNLELIVYGYEEVMISKFSLNKYYQKDNILLRDSFDNLFRVCDRDNLMYIYNYKKRNIYDDKYYDMGINSLRFNI